MMVDPRPKVPQQDNEKLRPPLRLVYDRDAEPTVETPDEAEQGTPRWPVLILLISGLANAVIAWFVAGLLAY
ncbi:hypothetical protein [Bosea sp. TAF32]|uniref:hypothetical protein n=1 Tax=Bosea sp. TAF32 TaxID=3237482 RepID=UPI003F8E059A